MGLCAVGGGSYRGAARDMTADSAIPDPPADDGAIDLALAGLDAAFADWAAAMTDAHAALSVVDESPAPGPDGSRLAEEIATDARFADPTPMFGDEPLPVEAEPAQAAETPVKAPQSGKAVKPLVDPDVRRDTRWAVAADADADQSATDEMMSEEDADALLMAALDPATAYAIRIKRRLTDRKLSVAELMDGLWPSDESAKAEAKKSKKWWRRRKSDR